jgi:hypothetical protein
VRWQPGLRASFNGLLKNSFGLWAWKWPRALVAVSALGFVTAAPAVAAWAAPTPLLRGVAALVLVLSMTLHGAAARRSASGSGLEGLTFPLCGLGLMGVLLTSAILATWRGGIVWRGTLYPLAALRAGCVCEADWSAANAVGWE